MSSYNSNLKNELALKTLEILGESDEVEKVCWMVVHEYHHGIKPFEYDIREIDETLYLSVLNLIKEKLVQ